MAPDAERLTGGLQLPLEYRAACTVMVRRSEMSHTAVTTPDGSTAICGWSACMPAAGVEMAPGAPQTPLILRDAWMVLSEPAGP